MNWSQATKRWLSGPQQGSERQRRPVIGQLDISKFTPGRLLSASILTIHNGPSSPFAHLQGPPFFQLQKATSCDTSRDESKSNVVASGLTSGLRLKCFCLGRLLFLFRLLLQALPPLEPNHQEPHRQEPHHQEPNHRRAMLPHGAPRHHQRDGWPARKGSAFAR